MENIPENYKPISPWTYFLLNIVFAIPLIGTIILIVVALGGTDNINKRNYARSFLLTFLITIILLLILGPILAYSLKGVLEQINNFSLILK